MKPTVRNRRHRRRRLRRNADEIVLYANPYDITARGWYFKSADEFDDKFASHLPVEEYEIEFINGSSEQAALFKAMGVNQANVGDWFELMDELEDYEQPALYWIFEYYNPGMDWEEARQLVEDEVRTMQGDAKEYAENYVDDMGGVGAR